MKDPAPTPIPIPIPNAREATVGAMLRKRRQSLRISLADVEIGTKIRGKYLVALESGDYSTLANDIYTRGFVQSYADFLGLDGAIVALQYQNERGGKSKPAAKPKAKRQTKHRLQHLVITPRLVIAAVCLVVAGAIIAYLSWQFQELAAPPRISVTSPATDQVIDGSLTDITGSVAGGADVFVNDSPVLTDADGNFNDKLALQEGVNTIRITAKNKLGKTTTVSRNILARLPKVAATDANAAFDGIQIVVSVKDSATALVVSVDDKEVFRGTMLSGTMQTFRGAGKISISTNNAGATSLSITNSTTADKAISPLGKDGEVKRNLEFSKDTVIP